MQRLILLIFLLISNVVFSQKNNTDVTALSENTDYFHSFQEEKFFLHTNKTTYFTGEQIWWKAYIVNDANDKPLISTANLYVNFYDSEKQLISHQLFHCKDGTSHGELDLPKTLISGTYYISLDTQWNRNFDSKYSVAINVVNIETESNTVLTDTEASTSSLEDSLHNFTQGELQVSFFPESGVLLKNTKNAIYFTIKNNNEFIPNQDVKIVNMTHQKERVDTNTNSYGHGKFDLFYEPNSEYALTFTYKNKTYDFKLPTALNTGVIVHKPEKDETDNYEYFVIKISEELAKNNHGETLFATIHRNQKIHTVKPFKIDQNFVNYSLKIEKQNLFNGINSLTVFNSKNKPIAERHFFVETKTPIQLETRLAMEIKDSMLIDFRIENNSKFTNLSISVLPTDTKLNEEHQTITDHFLITPYIKTKTPALSELSKTELDLLLQTQMQPTKMNTLINPIFKKEHGISIKGAVNTPLTESCKVVISSKANDILEITELNPNKSFEFNNLALNKSSDYKLSLINEEGTLVNAAFFIYNTNTLYKKDSILVVNSKPLLIASADNKTTSEPEVDYNISYKNAELLDEVELEGQGKRNEDYEHLYPDLPTSPSSAFSRGVFIDEISAMVNTVVQFLNKQTGVKASEGPIFMGISQPIYDNEGNIIGNTEQAEVSLVRIRFTRGQIDSPLIFLDNVITDPEVLYMMRLSDVKSIHINRTGTGLGMRGSNGSIDIITKNGNDFTKSNSTNKAPTTYTRVPDFGFSGASPYYLAPSLSYNTEESQQLYETLDWVPDYNVSPNTANTLKLYKGNHERVTLFINGFNTAGNLVSKQIDVTIPNNF
ncbi:hypothetical protein [Formosa sp. PL04]|uniref:hypothetical protein n=1 Tax=Formosa sp. PL04 TaxID=3081755 RepID=UPI00298127F0|nr:hypothetical protein [Formosa sp. PL04]MDW5290058.1 hypothetical protein [Formosa sp. PL04]